jgi:hypothetical protein
MSKTV